MALTRQELLPSTLITSTRLVQLEGGEAASHTVDVRIRDGVVIEVAPSLAPVAHEIVHDADGRWAMPGLWDFHVHMGQWASVLRRVDTSGTAGPEEVLARVTQFLAAQPALEPDALIVGWGHRSAVWSRLPTVDELDEVTGAHPVVLVSGDGHNGWLNSRAIGLLGAPADTTGPLSENDWFPVYSRVDGLPGVADSAEDAYSEAIRQANALGVVGITDLEFGPGYLDWPRRFANGIQNLRARAAIYPEDLEELLATGLKTGDELGETAGILRMGPLKIISDGSLNTRSAYCFEPYADAPAGSTHRGSANFSADQLDVLFNRARVHGLELAVHAIGDAAVAQALDCFASTGARGSIEHAQLIATEDIARLAELGISASVQPAHLLDDRDVTSRCWPDREERCFSLRSMLDAGVRLLMGSDAPVSSLDPWLTVSAAVFRSGDERAPWIPEQAISAREALARSTNGEPTIAAGNAGDVVLLDDDPLAAATDDGDARALAAQLRGTRVAATFLAGRAVYFG